MAYFSTGTWLAISAVTAVAGAGYGAYSQYEAGQNAAAMSRYNAQLQASQNQFQLEASAAKSLAERQENQRILKEQEAKFAAAGVVVNSGSPLTVEAKQAALLERRALNTDYAGALAYRTGTTQVVQDEATARAAKQAGNLNAAGTLLSGFSNAASKSYGPNSGG
jgi:hypothetical protein